MAEHTHSLSDRAVMGTAMFSQGASVYLALDMGRFPRYTINSLRACTFPPLLGVLFMRQTYS